MTFYDDTYKYKYYFFKFWYLFSFVLFLALLKEGESGKAVFVSNFVTYEVLHNSLLVFSLFSMLLNFFATLYNTKGIFLIYSIITLPLLPFNIYYMIKYKTF